MWDHPNPIFIDFETQSAADIKETGGRLYAFHPSTRILILSCCIDDTFHVWIPNYIRADISTWNSGRMWPHGLDKPRTVVLHRGDDIPPEILHPSAERPLVAHNAYGFDRFIWDRFIGTDVEWLDSLILAKVSGRPGRLDALGKAILGQGKDRAAKLMPQLCMGVERSNDSLFGGFDGWRYPLIRSGDLQAFTAYAIADVEILRRLWNEFDYLTVEEDVVRTHDNINNRGILVDSDLLSTIQRLSRYSVSTAVSEITEITNGRINANNLRSTKQIHEWLAEYDITVTDDSGKPCLRKDVVQRYIDSPYLIESNMTAAREIPPFIIDVLRLRMKALRITDAKVNRAIERIGTDGRVRDLHTYGTAHTGRFSSTGIQIHNLPRPLKGIDSEKCFRVFELCKQDKDIDRVYKRVKELIPKDSTLTVDDICSAMIRPTIMAPNGSIFPICDYATVEARGAAWCADEHKMLQSFKDGRDLYKEFAMKVFNKESVEQVTKDERQVAKSAVLGCIAEGTPILTNNGWKPIESISHKDLIWDGIDFVRHSGIIYKGEKTCIKFGELWLTPDHKILTIQGWLEVKDVILGSIPLVRGILSETGQLFLNIKLENERITYANVENINGTAIKESKYLENGLIVENSYHTLLHLKDGIIPIWSLIESTTIGTMNRETYDSQHIRSIVITNGKEISIRKTYDILNCGPRNQFQALSLICHNCQYGLGAEKFRIYAAANGADLQAAGVTAEQCIDTYRDTYTKICGFRPNRGQNFRTGGIWHILNDTVKKVIEERNPLSAGKCVWYLERGNLCCQLPSGRVMYYPDVRIEDVIPPYCYTMNLPLVPKATVVYTSPHGTKSLYGGLLLENIVQAICRDLLACALVQLENEGFNPVLHVHDEIVCEVLEFDSIKALHRMVEIMSTVPRWADGFPLACEGFLSKRFVKEPFEGYKKLHSKDLPNVRIHV